MSITKCIYWLFVVDVILMNKTVKQIQSEPKHFPEHFEQVGCGKVSPERKSIHRVDTKK
jgi:hypothetical protein